MQLLNKLIPNAKTVLNSYTCINIFLYFFQPYRPVWYVPDQCMGYVILDT